MREAERQKKLQARKMNKSQKIEEKSEHRKRNYRTLLAEDPEDQAFTRKLAERTAEIFALNRELQGTLCIRLFNSKRSLSSREFG